MRIIPITISVIKSTKLMFKENESHCIQVNEEAGVRLFTKTINFTPRKTNT